MSYFSQSCLFCLTDSAVGRLSPCDSAFQDDSFGFAGMSGVGVMLSGTSSLTSMSFRNPSGIKFISFDSLLADDEERRFASRL